MIKTTPVFLDLNKGPYQMGVAPPVEPPTQSGTILAQIRHLLGEDMASITLLTEEKDGAYRRLVLREDRLDFFVVKPFAEGHYLYMFEEEKITKNGQDIPDIDIDLFVKQLTILFSAYNKGLVTFYSEKKESLDSTS